MNTGEIVKAISTNGETMLFSDMVKVETDSGSFHICRYEVTQRLWKEVTGDDIDEVAWYDGNSEGRIFEEKSLLIISR